MLVYPKWLRISPSHGNMLFEAKDLDESMSKVYEAINGELSDENFAEVPYEAVAWFGHVKEKLKAPPSWQGHVHDGISARRMAGGVVGPDDISYDGSLGCLNHPESNTQFVTTGNYMMHGLLGSASQGSATTTLAAPGVTYLLTGRFYFDPGAGGAGGTAADEYTGGGAPHYYALATVPIDLSEFGGGELLNPVAVASVRAELSSDSLPESGIPQDGSEYTLEERFHGLAIESVEIFHNTGARAWSPDAACHTHPSDAYYLCFRLILPGIENTITSSVSAWWVHWILLTRLSKSEAGPPWSNYPASY